jgi:uncharacterized delta-60 repeat protein
MNRKWLRRMAVPIIVSCVGLANCSGNTSTTEGPPTAFAVVRLTPTGAADTTFGGGDGIVTTDPDPALFDFAIAVAVQSDNKILVAGSSGFAGQGQIALARYDQTGVLDTAGFGTAGTGGIVKTSLPSVASSAQAIAVQPDGKILVAALTFAGVSGTTATTGIALLRYNADGTLDTTGFGAPNGFVTAAIGPGTTSDTCALALQGTNIVVAGASSNGNVLLYRYTTSGVLDTTFGPNNTGVTTTNLGMPALSPAIALQTDNKIVVAGGKGSFSTSNQPVDQVVLRYTADGVLDTTTFGAAGLTPGIVSTDINSLGNYGNAVAIQGDGKIVVAGHANVNFSTDSSDISLVRYNTDGTLDTLAFGGGTGISITTLAGFDNALSVALQADSKIVVAGNTGSGGFTQTVVLRYNPNGTADTTFGVQGLVAPPLVGPSNISSGNAVALQTIGTVVDIVVAGYD